MTECSDFLIIHTTRKSDSDQITEIAITCYNVAANHILMPVRLKLNKNITDDTEVEKKHKEFMLHKNVNILKEINKGRKQADIIEQFDNVKFLQS
jgi:diaminopimelate epimerase